MKRSPLRRRCRTSYAETVQPDRQAWAYSMPHQCMVCGRPYRRLDVHEIERRSQAPKRWGHRCNYLLVCSGCHTDYGAPLHAMPHVEQLAIKLLRDRKHYDLAAWLSLGRRPDTYVTQEDVDLEIAAMEAQL